MCRATGSTSPRRPSRTACPTCAGIDASSSAAVAASASICARDRSSATLRSAGCGRPSAAAAIRCFARSRADSSIGGEATLTVGWTHLSSTTTCRPSSSPNLRSNRATLRGSSSFGSRPGRSSTECSPSFQMILGGELTVLNDSRVVSGRLRLTRSSGGGVEVLLVERLDDAGLWEGLARPSRRLRVGERLGPVELVERLGERTLGCSARGGAHRGHSAASVHPRVARRRGSVPNGVRDETPGRRPRRRQDCTSRTTSFVGSSM